MPVNCRVSGPIRSSTDLVLITSSRTELSVVCRTPASLPIDTAASSRAVSMTPSVGAMRAVGKDGWDGHLMQRVAARVTK